MCSGSLISDRHIVTGKSSRGTRPEPNRNKRNFFFSRPLRQDRDEEIQAAGTADYTGEVESEEVGARERGEDDRGGDHPRASRLRVQFQRR